MKTKTVSTLELKVGDVVHFYGGRFELTECLMDATVAKRHADANVSMAKRHHHSEDELAEIRERDENCRAYRSKFLGPVRDDVSVDIPTSMDYFKGNHRAMWTVEC